MNLVCNFVCIVIAVFSIKVSLAIESDLQFPVFETNLGKYVGLTLKSRNGREYFACTGIPYAYPPARFEPSTLANGKWDGIRDARNAGSKCIQSGLSGYSLVEGREDENCLFLNVYVPKEGIDTNESLPVMVYIHEGLFSSGEGIKHGAKYFMDQNVVLVTINYRLGVLGFLNTGDGVVRGNLGLMDQVNALKWVQEHIYSFGGDPDRVTIFGNDAGAVSVSLLLVSPSANGLFHRAIAQSGSSLVPWGWQSNPKANAMKLGQILNCPTTNSREMVRCLKTLPAIEIGRAEQKFIKWFRDPIATFVPSLELAMEGRDSFLTQHPLSLLMNGNFQKVPLMTGIVEDEGLLHSAAIVNDERRLTEINNEWFKFAPVTLMYSEIEPKQTRGRISTRINQFYFGGKFVGEETLQNLTNLYTDRYFLRGIKLAAMLHARFASVFPYIFSYQGDHSNLASIVGVRSVLGVAHTDELQYLFNSESDPEFSPGSESERISKNLVRLWVSFAETGLPLITSRLNRQQSFRPIQTPELEGATPFKWHKIDSETRLIQDPFSTRLQSWNVIETPFTSTVSGINSNSPPSQNSINRFTNSNTGNPNGSNPFVQIAQGFSNVALQFLDIFNRFLVGIQRPFQQRATTQYITRNQYRPTPAYNNGV